MFDAITVSADTLMEQAHLTAALYLKRAVEDIDALLGEGAARRRPELVAAYMQTASIDMAGAIIAQQIRAGLDEIAAAIADRINRIVDDGILCRNRSEEKLNRDGPG